MIKNSKSLLPDSIKVSIKSLIKQNRPAINHFVPTSFCPCCGSTSILYKPKLWDTLIQDWQLSDHETAYINRQQGVYCKRCKVNLRGMAIAYAILRREKFKGYLKDIVRTRKFRKKRILEVNEAAWLTPYLSKIPDHILAEYPEVDMQHLPYQDGVFDIVVHSDTLEHVPDPLAGLRECYRVLVPGGYCVFTVPMVVGRLSKSRAGLPTSYHGSESKNTSDYIVHTEFGADAWTLAMQAGFCEIQIHCLEYPAAISFLCLK